MIIPVLSGAIPTELVCDLLREHGLIVIETTRTHAKSIKREAMDNLGINRDSEEGPRLVHLAAKGLHGGLSDFLMYSSVYEYIPGETERLVVKAVSSWDAAASPNIHLAKVVV